MKFKRTIDLEDMNEEFTSEFNRDHHYNHRHADQYKDRHVSVEEYEKIADKLQRTPVDNRKIFGYMSQTREGRTAYCKYNKETEDFVVYTYRKNEPLTVTLYKKNWRDFNGDKAIEYFDEIPLGK